MFKNILLATDGSDISARAAIMAVNLARVHGAKITAVYVMEPYPYLGIGEASPYGMQAYAAAAQKLAADAHMAVETLCTQAGSAAVPLEARAIENVGAPTGIVQTAKAEGADLIVMGSHGRSGIARMMLGSVANRVLAESPVPVLVVR